jgi:hypothetical protein
MVLANDTVYQSQQFAQVSGLVVQYTGNGWDALPRSRLDAQHTETVGYTVLVWVVDRSPESQGEYEIVIISESYYIMSPTTIFIKQDYTNRSDHLEIERRKLV